ncbi:peptidase inhibitor family I36 protein, partial [Streptomyces sp. T-3]|nr:peptidase inhibitor family I36 protein [Streptomyces sp. T-3]
TWAFGVLAHVTLTGTLPLPGATPSARREAGVRYARGTDELRLSPELPDDWREIITDCLSPTHAERAAHDTASLLRRVESAAGAAPSPSLRPLSRNRWLWAGTAAVVAGVTALVLALSGGPEKPGGENPEAVGYDRCEKTNICFFTEKNGKGDMCAWDGDDIDWNEGEERCGWTTTKEARSVFNNGVGNSDGEVYVDVVYFAKPKSRDHLGCVERGTKANFPEPVRPKSHVWATKC